MTTWVGSGVGRRSNRRIEQFPHCCFNILFRWKSIGEYKTLDTTGSNPPPSTLPHPTPTIRSTLFEYCYNGVYPFAVSYPFLRVSQKRISKCVGRQSGRTSSPSPGRYVVGVWNGGGWTGCTQERGGAAVDLRTAKSGREDLSP